MDEVGRGSLAGPVTVGAVLVLTETRSAPTGLRDSKALSPKQREALYPRVLRWAPAHGVGHASAEEIDVVGLTAALRLAGVRALRALGRPVAAVLLDGSHDWLGSTGDGVPEFPGSHRVTMRVKADRDCSSVAAASVLAKVERDRIMARLDNPGLGYGWCSNKGYAAPEHLSAIAQQGPSKHHRLSWQLPGTDEQLHGLDPERRRTWRRLADGEQLLILPPGTGADPATPTGAGR